jgi:alkylmercury lyase-like protein
VDARDLRLRNATYGLVRRLGRPPLLAEIAAEAAMPEAGVAAGWRRLHDAHALVLRDDGELRMAAPFSAVPTPYVVRAGGASWFGNCAWDAFGVCAALGSDGHVSSTCPDCGEALDVDVRGGRPQPADAVVHLLVPAARWWDDIVFT